MSKKILHKVNKYYSDKIIEHGSTSQGVDWNGIESHYLRFDQLSNVINKDNGFTILDFGCGFGSYIDYLKTKEFKDFQYIGFDISEEMLKEANRKFSEPNIEFVASLDAIESVDFTIANGIFNVKLDSEIPKWEAYIMETLEMLNAKSTSGFSFNILTSFSDKEFMKPNLFYADPMKYFKYCKDNFSKNVALLHDYELYEFTIIVRKS